MENYLDAYKQGKACFKKYGYLPVLDQLLPDYQKHTGVNIGYKRIPLAFVVGTKTESRAYDFAHNFMPIQDETSEFAYKWENLCQSHLNEGIREPITVWEYMNRYYVQEGNKRVSVMKYFDGWEIPAYVKRIYPKKSDDKDVQRYYEYLNFCEKTNVDFLEFSQIEYYSEFIRLVDLDWKEDQIRNLKSVYYHFTRSFYACFNKKIDSNLSDAFVTYIKIFGYDLLKHQSEKEIEWNLKKILKEIELQKEDDLIEVVQESDAQKKKLVDLSFKKKKVAFIYENEIEYSGWRQDHELGREHVQKILEKKIETCTYIASRYSSNEETIRKAIDEGATIVFATEVNLYDVCLKCSVEYPHVKIFNCSLNKPMKSIYTYYPRMYEAKFITGAIAGAMSQNDKIGYICKYPIYGTIAEINAFARGVALVNPKAKVYLEWSSKEGVPKAQQALLDEDIHIISYREYGDSKDQKNRQFGLAMIEDQVYPLVLPVWNWSIYYEKLLESILDGSFDLMQKKSSKSLNYYWGISSGVIDIIYSPRIPQSVRYMAQTLFQSIKLGIAYPFYSDNENMNGTFMNDISNKSLDMEKIITMATLEENVVGELPAFEQLSEQVQKVVLEMGIRPSRKEF